MAEKNQKHHPQFWLVTVSRRYLIAALILLLLFPAAGAFAQLCTGSVKDKQDNAPLSGVLVSNHRNQQRYYTDEKGLFFVNTKAGDTLHFEVTGYFPYQYIIPATGPTADKVIKLSPDIQVIDSVTVDRELTQYQKDSLQRRSMYASTLGANPENAKIYKNELVARSTFGLTIDSPISSLLQRKKKKKLKNFKERFGKGESEHFIFSVYNPAIVSQLTGLNEEDAAKLIATYPMEEGFARNANDLELQSWISYNYRKWAGEQAATAVDSLKN